MLESGQGYWQLAVREEKGIRNRSNSLSSLISEAVYLQVFLQLCFSFRTDSQWKEEICLMVALRGLQSLELPRSGNGTHAFCQGNFFFSHQISGHARKRAIDRSRGKCRAEEIVTAACVLRA